MFNNKSKWYISFLIAILLVLAACGDDNGDSGASGGSSDGNGESAQEENGEDTDNTDDGNGDSSSGEVQGVTDDEILIGNIVAHTGPQAIYGQIAQGIQTYFDYVNENGGVHGRQLTLLAYDGEYQPAVQVQQAQRLVEQDGIFVMLGNDCTPCNTALMDYYIEQEMISFMLGSGADHFYNPPNEWFYGSEIMNYRVETKVFYDYAVNELGAEKIAIAYQNDDYGLEGYEAVMEIKDDYDAELIAEVPFVASADDFSTQAQQIRSSGADTVIMLSTPNPAGQLKQELHSIGVTDINYMVSAVGGNDLSLYDLAGEDIWEGSYSAGIIPIPGTAGTEDDEAMQRYVELYTAAYPGENYSGVPQWGYAGAEVFVEALERAGRDLNYDTLREAIYTFDNWQEGTYAGVSFSPENHMALTSMFITRAQNGTIEQISGIITFDPATGEITYE